MPEAVLWSGPIDFTEPVTSHQRELGLRAAGFVEATDVEPEVLTEDQRITVQESVTDMCGTDLANVHEEEDADDVAIAAESIDDLVAEAALDTSSSAAAAAARAAAARAAIESASVAIPDDADSFVGQEAEDFPQDRMSFWDQAEGRESGEVHASTITPGDCTGKAAQKRGGWVKNHFEYCATVALIYTVFQGGETTGEAIVQYRNRGWASKNSRRVEFVLDVLQIKTFGVLTPGNTYLTLSEGCVGSGLRREQVLARSAPWGDRARMPWEFVIRGRIGADGKP